MSVAQRFAAPAKLNLMLRVVGRRADGYHLLQTVFRFIDWCDVVSLTVRHDGVIARRNDVAGIPAALDLTVRAANLLKTATATALGADIELEKRLPLGGGVGGGSSDAATALLALNQLWGTQLTRAELQALALDLGADVPAFVYGSNAFAEGIGERLTAVDLPAAWYLVLVPPVAVPTARIFAHPELKRDSIPIRIQGFSAGQAGNDLEAVVCREFPEVGRYLDALRRVAPAWVTGSGGCVFASFPTESAARAARSCLPAQLRGVIARGLDAHPLRELAPD